MATGTLGDWGHWAFDWDDRDRLFRSSVGTSFVFHGLLWLLAWLAFNAHFQPPPAIEVDLNALVRPRSPFDTRLPGAPKGAPKLFPVRTHGDASPLPPSAAPRNILVPPSDMTKPPEKEKPWVLPGPNSKIEKPKLEPEPVPVGNAAGALDGTGPGGEGGRGGHGGGTGTGEPWVDRKPRLINGQEILNALRWNFPISERQAGRSGTVKVHMMVGTDGRVSDVRVVVSAGEAFDSAAIKVARKMQFEPAFKDSLPVSFPIVVPMTFNIEDR